MMDREQELDQPPGQQEQVSPPNAHDKHIPQEGTQNGTNTFVNHGLQVWLERRRQWRSESSSEEALRQKEESRKRKRSYTPTVTVGQLLSFQPLPHPVPLEEAVEILAELWESEEPF